MEERVIAVLLTFALAVVGTVNGQKLFPFGPEAGDVMLEKENDVSAKVDLGSPFTYYGKKYSSVYVNDNGVLSFVNDFAAYDGWQSLPITTPGKEIILIAPYLADVDLSISPGAVFYRETKNEGILQRAKDKITQFFVRHSDFKPKNVLIVTWDLVGFQGSTATIPKTNTFQCVVASDAVNTFVFFIYDTISWTTSISGGGSETGLGANLPQVGFNAGDGRDTLVLEEPTVLPTSSNVVNPDPPGLFLFHVSGASVESPLCQKSGSPQVYPNHASMLGGSKLTFGGPCFGENDDIRFRFSDKETEDPISEVVTCEYFSAYQASCIQPQMNMIGDVKASLSTDSGKNWDFVDFTLMPIASVAPGVVQTDAWSEKWLQVIEPLEITWDKSLFNDTKVNVTVMSYREENSTASEGAHEWINTVLAADVPNSGRYRFTPRANPAITPNNVMGVIRVTAASKPNGLVLSSDLHFLGYLLGDSEYQTNPKTWSNDYCKEWYEKDKLKGDFLDDLNACPCSLEQALADSARFVANPYCDATKQPADSPLDYCFARPDIKHCVLGIVRKSDEDSSSPSLADSECCYDGEGNLVYAQDSDYGSFSNRISRYSGAVPGLSGASTDLVPYIFCIVMGEDSPHYFREQRPTKDCREYEPVRPAIVYGDPHFKTFDDFGYTFNGLGEYVLVRTVAGPGPTPIRVQGRFQRVSDENGVARNATVLTALAIVENDQVQNKIQVDRNDITLMTLKVGDRGTLQDIGRSPYQQYPNFLVLFPENKGTGVVPKMVFLFQRSQIGVVVEATDDMLSATVLLPSEYKGERTVEGLFGNWNEKSSDDLKKPDGSVLQDKSPQAIFSDFGQKWEATSPIFVYSGSENHAGYQDNNFRPILEEPTGVVSEQLLRRVCGPDKFCRFDFAVTKKQSVAFQTFQDSEAFNRTMTASLKLSMCPFPPTPSHGEKEFVGDARHHAPGSIIRYTCHDGYIFFGNSQRECNEDGDWSDTTEPSCKEVKCGTLNAPEHGTMKVQADGDKIVATFECAKDTTLIGSKTRTCGENNKWSGEETKCVEDRGGSGNTAVIVVVVIVVIIVIIAVAGGAYYFWKKKTEGGSQKVTRPPDSAYQPVSGEVADVELGLNKDKPSGDDEGGFTDKDSEKDKESEKEKEKEKEKEEESEEKAKDSDKDSD